SRPARKPECPYCLELIWNNVLEPWLYGSSVGLSDVAVIIAAVFWTLLWGPMGLVLSTPMTVCLVVMGKHLPALAIFDRLLSDQPALESHVWLFQRLMARDSSDAEEIIHEHLQQHGFVRTCDELLLPTLVLVKGEWVADRIDEHDQDAILDTLRVAFRSLSWSADEANVKSDPGASEKQPAVGLVIGFPVREEDDLVLQLVNRILSERGFRFRALSSEMLVAERLAVIADERHQCVCVSSVAPGDLQQTTQICKRLLIQNPDLSIVVGRWGAGPMPENEVDVLQSAGRVRVVGSMSALRDEIIPIVQFLVEHQASKPAPDSNPPLTTSTPEGT
ncbi:MAG: AI-2E family transporter, partial [Planctomycetaceae bacterium]|nr:AI-2E family transporter [Planctomycetaceae bacterium]